MRRQELTGFDWEGVAMTLSTSVPSLDLSPPKPSPWHVRGFYRRRAAEAAGSPRDAKAYGRKLKKLERELQDRVAKVDEEMELEEKSSRDADFASATAIQEA
ncbi:MAG: hypothetical protein U5N86_06930 [Planctomycetota bacterium]|nr:hypothetical protein [Planctomycetota bacterium]